MCSIVSVCYRKGDLFLSLYIYIYIYVYVYISLWPVLFVRIAYFMRNAITNSICRMCRLVCALGLLMLCCVLAWLSQVCIMAGVRNKTNCHVYTVWVISRWAFFIVSLKLSGRSPWTPPHPRGKWTAGVCLANVWVFGRRSNLGSVLFEMLGFKTGTTTPPPAPLPAGSLKKQIKSFTIHSVSYLQGEFSWVRVLLHVSLVSSFRYAILCVVETMMGVRWGSGGGK